jgi:Spy/CpxP family protein refolding chaperone
MNKTIRTLNVAIMAVALLTGITTARAEPMGNGGHMWMGHHFKKALMTIPNLTTEQRQKVEDLLNTAKTQSAPLKDQILTARKELGALWAADTMDRSALTAKQGEIEGALAKLKPIWASFFIQLHDVLTSPQRAWLVLHGPGMHDGPNMGMVPDHECPCNQPEQK